MLRPSVALIPLALLLAACGGDPAPAPAPEPVTPKEFVQQVWDGWSEKDHAATCKEYGDYPERTAENLFPASSGIPTAYVADLLKRECN